MQSTFDNTISASLALVPICKGNDLISFDIDLFYYRERLGNQLIFRFVTRSGDMPGTLCVTGKIIVPALPHHA